MAVILFSWWQSLSQLGRIIQLFFLKASFMMYPLLNLKQQKEEAYSCFKIMVFV